MTAKKCFNRFIPFLILGVCLASIPAYSQSVLIAAGTASGTPGSTVTIPITLTSSGGALPTGLEWAMSYPAGTISSVSVAAGPAATSIGYTPTCGGNPCTSPDVILFGFPVSSTIPNGVVVIASFTISPSTLATSIPIQISTTSASDSAANSIPSSGSNGLITVNQPVTAAVSSVTCSPSPALAPGTSACTVNLTLPAAGSGLAVTLGSSNGNVSVPANVTVPSGQSSAGFTATVSSVTTDQTATITATGGGASKTFSLGVSAPAQVTGLSCNPTSLATGGTSTCTVTLNKSAPVSTTVALSSDNGLLGVPGTMIVPVGSLTNTFTATAQTITTNQTANLSASANGGSASATISLVVATQLSGLNCSPATVNAPGSSTCTVSLTGIASGTQTVSLSSGNGVVTVPASVQILSGQSSATFQANAASVSSDQSSLLSASLNSATKTFTLNVGAPAFVTSVSCSPGTLSAGSSATCTVSLTKAAPSSLSVTLGSNNAALTIPGSVTVNSGASSATFLATAGGVSTQQIATVSASNAGITKTTTVTVSATAALSSLTCSPSTVSAPGSASCTVTLTANAGSTQTVALSSGNGNVTVPVSMPIFAGQISATFQATVAAVTVDQPAQLTATLNAGTQNFTLSLSAPAQVSTLSCNPSSLSAGVSSTCTVTLNKTAPSAVNVTLSSSPGPLTIPAGVTVQAGATSTTFTATAGTLSTNQTISLTALANGGPATTSINLVTTAQLSSLSCSPATVNAPGSSLCTVTLTGAAAGGQTVALSSNNLNASIPGSVQIASGQTSATFQATVAAVSSDQTAQLTASLNSVTQNFTLNLSGPVQLSGVSCTPSTLGSGSAAPCTVTLNKAATSAVTVTLSSNNVAVSVPGTVTVASGSSAATFSAAAGTVSTSQTATVSATSGATVKTTTVTVSATVQLSQLNCAPGTVAAPGTSICSVSLTGTAVGIQTIALSSGNSNVTVPGSVQIASGQSSATFQATVAAVTADQTAVLTGSLNSMTQSFTLTLAAPVVLTAVSCSPSSVASGASSTCTVTLSKPASSTTFINVSSDNAALPLPATATVNAGSSTGTFLATAAAVSTAQTVNVTATNGTITKTAVVTITPAPVAKLSCSPNTVSAPGSSSCTVTLSASGSATLTSDNPHATVPPNVSVSANQPSSFTVAVASILTDETANITTVMNGQTLSTSLTLVAGSHLSSITCTPSELGTGDQAACTVTLSKSTSNDVTVAIGSTNQALAVPSSVVVPANQLTATFQVIAAPVGTQQTAIVQASWSGFSAQAIVVVRPAGAPVLHNPDLLSRPITSPVTFSVTATDPSNLAVVLSVTGLPSGSTFNTSTGAFVWNTPGPLGTYTMTFRARNSAGIEATRSTTIILKPGNLPLLGVFNAVTFSQDNVCSPGSVASVFGGGFTGLPPAAGYAPTLPLELTGLSIQVNFQPVPLYYVSDSLVNFQCPILAPGTKLTIMAETANGFTAPFVTTMLDATPGVYVFSNLGPNQGAIVIANTNDLAMPVTQGVVSRPAQPGEYISIYGIGLGLLDNQVPAGSVAPLDPLSKAINKVTVVVGGEEITPSFAGLAPTFVGLYLVNAKLPDDVPIGNQVGVYLKVTLADGSTHVSNLVTMATGPKPH